MSDELRLFATTDAIYPNIKEVSSDDIIADSGITTSYFVVTVPPNTLTANITPISGITYTHYVITVDDSDTPTFPTDFTNGVVPLTKNLADWASEVWRLWVYDLPTTTGPTEITAPDGTSGVTVTPNDTLIPFGALALSNGTNADTEIDWVIASSDDESGIDSTLTKLINASTLQVISVGAASGTWTGLNPSTEYTLQAEVFDNYNNKYEVVAQSHTTASAVSGTGTIEFTETELPAYEVAEDVGSGDIDISLTLTGRTDNDEKACTVSTRAWTTDGTNQVTALTNASVTFTTGADPQTATVTITLTDQSLAENNMFEVYIDDGSEAGDGAGAPKVGARNAILVYLTGSGTIATTGYQDYDDSSRQIVVLDTDMTDLTITVPVGGKTDEYELATAPGSDTNGPTDALRHTKSTGQGYVNIDPFPDASSVTIPITLSKTASWYVWARIYASGSNYSTHYGFDSNWVNQSQFARADTGSTWHWRPVGTASGDVATGYNVSTGDHTLHIATREESVELWTNQIAITDDVSYDMTALSALATLSTKGSSEPPTDNPDNPSNPIGPPTSVTVTPTFSPLDDATDVQTNVDLTMTFTGMTEILFSDTNLTVTTDGGIAPGAWSSNGINVLTFKLSAGQSWVAGGDIIVTGSDFGSIIDSGERKSIETIGAGDWNMTAVDNQPSDYIYEVNFETITGVPRNVISSDILAPNGIFHSEGWATNPNDNPDGVGDGNTLRFVADPKNSGKGTVIEYGINQGNGSHNFTGKVLQARHYDIVNPIGGTVLREVYMAEDLLVPATYEAPASVHMSGVWSAADHRPHGGVTPDDIEPNKCQATFNFWGLASGRQPGSNALGLYVYHNKNSTGWYGPFWGNTVNPGTGSSFQSNGQVRIPLDQWFTLELRMKLNTFNGSTPNNDGIIQGWIDGVLMVDIQGLRLISVDHAAGINMVTPYVDYGGNDAIALADDLIWADNLRVATFPITH